MKFLFKLLTLLFLSNTLFAQSGIIDRKNKQEKGFFNVTEIGIFLGNNNLVNFDMMEKLPVNVRSLRTINGIFINPKLSLGIGIGLDGIDTKYYNFHNTFNISADARYYLKTAHDGFFFYGNIGPSLKIDDNFEEGLMANAGLGHKVTIGSSFVIVPSIGYYHQNYKRVNSTFNVNAVAFKLGFLF
ncbi:MAG TPA: hypothetical protein VL088_08355 [Pedobacter sp.]|nr:hypothetical protein [Pedobacter sp.]